MGFVAGLLRAVLIASLTVASQAFAQDASTGSQISSLSRPLSGAAANLDSHAFQRGKAEVPNLLKIRNVACTMTQAAYLGAADLLDDKGKRAGAADIYETACAEGLGYFFSVQKKKPPIVFDCILAAQFGKITCMLPRNRHPAGGLNPFLKAAGVDCSALRARMITQDSNLKLRRYEVACAEGGGYILDAPLFDGTGPAPIAADCLEALDACQFTPRVESVAMLAHKVGATLGEGCKISDARYVGYVEASQRNIYEIGCQKGHDGILIELDRSEAIRQSMPCKNTKLIGAACQLKPNDQSDPLIAHAEASGASPPMVATNPSWLQRPSNSDLADLYPWEAVVSHLAGQATVTCRTASSGLLQDCFVIDESPAGYGFGAAALKMTAKFRMKPGTQDGVPIGGEHVTVPINFALSSH